MCTLHKTPCGLKQASRAWFHCFSLFLMNVGFSSGHIDSLLFIVFKGDNLIYLLLYVDDIVVTSNNSILLDGFISILTKEFATSDIFKLFLSLGAHQHFTGLFRHVKYAYIYKLGWIYVSVHENSIYRLVWSKCYVNLCFCSCKWDNWILELFFLLSEFGCLYAVWTPVHFVINSCKCCINDIQVGGHCFSTTRENR